MPKTAKFDPKAWAKTARKDRGGSKCRICRNPDAAEAVRIIVQEILAGRSDASVSSIRLPINEHFGMDVSPTAIRYHVRNHLKDGARALAR